jgi:hypothetical protein
MSLNQNQKNNDSNNLEKAKDKNGNPNFVKNKTQSNFKNIKRISKNLISLARNEIKNSNKNINIAKYESNKDFLAPSNYTISKKEIGEHRFSSFKPPDSKNDQVEEKAQSNEKKEKNCKKNIENNPKTNNNGEISSSDISSEDEDEDDK